ncbi:MAG: transglutaminase-like domain-containing protein [Gimesia sp.]|nr:transglutaminase-like domain-containing protein [Gimesia sp.]
MSSQRTVAFILISLECATFGILSETLFLCSSIVLIAALSYLPILQYPFSRRQVFWITSILAMLFMVKYVLSPHEFGQDRSEVIRTPLAYAAAQFIIALQLRQLFDKHFIPFLPNSFPLLGILVFILIGDIQVHGSINIYYQVFVFSYVLMTGVFYQFGHVFRSQKNNIKKKWVVYLIRFNFFVFIWLIGWLTATGLHRYEREMDQLYYRLIEPSTSGMASRAGFSTISKLGSLTSQFDSGAQQVKLRIKSSDEPGYMRGRAFVQFFNSEWHSEIGSQNVASIGLPPAGVKTEIIPEGTWFQIGQANSSDWIEYEVWSASTEHIFAPLNTPLVHAVAENMQIDSQNILTSRTMENGYPYALFLPRKQLPPAPESVVSLRRLLQLPFGISPRVQQLANQIFADCKTSAEKINRVQNYFQNQYEYEIGIKIPQGNDPLTYFLLEKPNAHCEYFASGTAILLRMAGVPCRYVTGYIVRERNVYDQFWVARSRHAHAWVEAWDEQRGWVTVESTPAAGRPDQNTPGGVRQYWESLIGQYSRLKTAVQRGEWVLALSEAQLPLALLICGVALWFGFRWVFQFCQKRLKERALFQQNPVHVQELHQLLAQMDRLLGKHKIVRKPDETLMQFSRRIQSQAVAQWYRNYACSRFMPESAETNALILQLKQQILEFRQQKSLI